MEQQKTRVERISSQIKSNPIVAALIILGTIVIALATFTDAATKLFNLVSGQSPAAARVELARMSLGYTSEAFVLSAGTGDLMAVKLFLTAGMDPNATDKNRTTALGTASYTGHVQIVTALVKAGADVGASAGHSSALVSAASGGHIDSLRVLLDKSPDAETINAAFIEAARTRHLEVVRLLADKGAEVKRVGSIAMLSLSSERWGDQEVSETMKILLDLGADPNAKDEEGWTALLGAAHRGYPTAVRLLLDRGADANARCACPHVLEGGWTALLLAIEGRHLEVVETLLGKGANVNQRNNQGEGALLMTAHGGDQKLFLAVLGSNVDVNEKGDGGQTALMALAAATQWSDRVVDHPDAVRALLQKGARINEKDAAGRTALMFAAQSGSTSVVRALLESGARVDDKDAAGKTALRFVSMNLYSDRANEVIQQLQSSGRK